MRKWCVEMCDFARTHGYRTFLNLVLGSGQKQFDPSLVLSIQHLDLQMCDFCMSMGSSHNRSGLQRMTSKSCKKTVNINDHVPLVFALPAPFAVNVVCEVV